MKQKYGLDGLFSRPTGVKVEEDQQPANSAAKGKGEPRKVGRPRKPEGERETDKLTRVTFLANVDTIAKVRAIAAQEQLTIKDVIDTALVEIIRRYEKKHGAVCVTKEAKKSKTLMDVL